MHDARQPQVWLVGIPGVACRPAGLMLAAPGWPRRGGRGARRGGPGAAAAGGCPGPRQAQPHVHWLAGLVLTPGRAGQGRTRAALRGSPHTLATQAVPSVLLLLLFAHTLKLACHVCLCFSVFMFQLLGPSAPDSCAIFPLLISAASFPGSLPSKLLWMPLAQQAFTACILSKVNAKQPSLDRAANQAFKRPTPARNTECAAESASADQRRPGLTTPGRP